MSEKTIAMHQIEDFRERLKSTQTSLAQALHGKEQIIEFSLTAILARGHILLEGPPGTGKTSLARALARAFGDDFRRIQLTSDLLPSDIVGFLRLKPGTTEFEFRRGPIFTHFLLADEINRSNPKTQSALLEAMAESTVTVDGITHPLPNPFFVVATKNPLESHGVYPLAESQLDRFMLQLPFDFPELEDELQIYKNATTETTANGAALLSLSNIVELQEYLQKVYIEESVLNYILELVRTSRSLPQLSYGVSIRGGLHFLSATRTLAFLRGRNFVTPLEVQDLAIPALAHRLCFKDGTENYEKKCQAITQILKQVRAPR